ncbi:MAG: HAD-IIIC family phosphatase [Synechocystis sp.]|jgi:HAD superfamily phosphatase (TIGR01681 family)
MANSDKMKKNTIFAKDELHNSWPKIDNSYIEVYVNCFVKKFRNYNDDKFIITISGFNKFIDHNDEILIYLFKQFKENNFDLVFIDEKDNIHEMNIDCTNITKNISYDFNYQIQNLINIVELSSKTDIPIVGIFIMKIIAQIITKSKILYKAIILDLDDTLWPGTLAEVGINTISEFLSCDQGTSFIAFMKFCCSLANELGIYIALCSRNDSNQVENAIKTQLSENLFPLKNQIDCIVANNNDKTENIQTIAKELGILTENIVFIDDNKIIRDEVKNKLPNVFVPEWSNHEELLTQLTIGCIFGSVHLDVLNGE